MRIIAGEFRSRRLKSIPGAATRPTPDRLRETLFDILGPRIEGATFLDAYAGTGAVGIEALSRGAAQSYCILVTEKMNDAARERIHTLVDSTDGFYISEMDLKLRGPGEFFGTKQSGLPSLRVANILRDGEILEVARRSRPSDARFCRTASSAVRWRSRKIAWAAPRLSASMPMAPVPA